MSTRPTEATIGVVTDPPAPDTPPVTESTTVNITSTLSSIATPTEKPDNNAEINWIIIGSVMAIVLVSFAIAMFCVISRRRKERSAKQNRAGGFFPGSSRPSAGGTSGHRIGAGGGRVTGEPGQMPQHAVKGIPG
ncbi:hypothetical protein RvY_16227 [Ramazzottius varieornatus]|uniref:Uncharacterized protein n=1 Tax=Ramazzottius varieornatus TaxID=947166 RepID=A0A1D1VXS2_RAMVA|nr:hypothetical protein RvY_16227 [Ramazzottius varieornatus]